MIKRIEDLLVGVHLLPLPNRLRREGLIGVLLMCPIKTFMRERERLPKNPRDDIPSSVCAMDMEFVARHQPSEYMAQMPSLLSVLVQTLGST